MAKRTANSGLNHHHNWHHDDVEAEEELFHLEMSDEGSGGRGKRSKLVMHSGLESEEKCSTNLAHRGLLPSNIPPPMGPVDLQDHTTKSQPMTSSVEEEELKIQDDDPHMARAAIYYLLAQEDKLMSRGFYDGKNRINPKSVTITAKSRQKLLSWLFLVNQQFAYEFDTWVLAASILDRFLVAQPIDKDIFQLSGCSAFLLAAKHEERDPPKLVELVKPCAHCYMKSDFIKMERIMLRSLDWNLMSPNVHVLLREVCLAQKISLSSDFVISMLKRVIIHHNLPYMPPSKLSFSLISAVDQCPRVNDVDKTFQLLLYLLKQDPLEQSLFDDEP